MTTEQPADAILLIERQAQKYSQAREVLAGHVADFNAALDKLRQQYLPGIRKAAARCQDLQSELARDIAPRPDLFVKPRTMTLSGIKVGFQKGKGKLVWDDEEKVVARIKDKYSKQRADVLIIVTEKPSKEALGLLPAAELKALGVTIEDAADTVYIKAIDSEIDKLVARILDEGAIEEEA